MSCGEVHAKTHGFGAGADGAETCGIERRALDHKATDVDDQLRLFGHRRGPECEDREHWNDDSAYRVGHALRNSAARLRRARRRDAGHLTRSRSTSRDMPTAGTTGVEWRAVLKRESTSRRYEMGAGGGGAPHIHKSSRRTARTFAAAPICSNQAETRVRRRSRAQSRGRINAPVFGHHQPKPAPEPAPPRQS